MVVSNFLLLALLIFSLLFIMIRRYKKTRFGKSSCAPPGPVGLPFIGNLHQIDTNNSHVYFWKLSKKYGPIMSLKLGCKPLLVISSARLVEVALKTEDLAFSGRSVLYSTKKLAYNCVDIAFSPYNHYWREMRKICTLRLFSIKQVQFFRPIREDEVARLMEQISRRASTLEVFNLSKMIMSLTSTLICRIAFGKRYDDEGNDKRRFDELLLQVQVMVQGFFFSNYFPSLGWIDNLTGLSARLERTAKHLDSFCEEIIEEHLNSDKKTESMENDILSLLLQLREDNSTPFDLTMDHVKALLLDIFIGGTDTSAATILWAMTALMKAPHIMRKVQAEMRGLLENKGIITEHDIENLPYFKAVVKETFRFFPPIPLLLPRETTQKCVIDGYEIQPKTIVFINAWAVSRDEEYWENPDEFLPERFLNNGIDYKGQHFGLIPFGAGRRGCPAIIMGTTTVELVLANLLYSFDWELPPGMKKEDVDTDIIPGLAMHKKNPLFFVAKKHQN